MNLLNLMPVLFAESAGYRHMGERFRPGGASFDFRHLLVGLVAIGALIFLTWLLQQWMTAKSRPGYHSRGALFRELCRAHHLGWTSRWLLRRLARRQQLTHPARLFLEPERFDAARSKPFSTAHRAQLEAIRDKLFGVKLG